MSGAQANQMAGLSAISQMNAARMGMIGDIIGGIAGGLTTGGMSNLAEGLSFFGKKR
jgi:predicted lipid-binding transport protein (Tim44 family)